MIREYNNPYEDNDRFSRYLKYMITPGQMMFESDSMVIYMKWNRDDAEEK